MANRNREAQVRDKIAAGLKERNYQAVTEYTVMRNPATKVSRIIDVYAKSHGGTYIIEVKHAGKFSDGIGQLLTYECHHGRPVRLMLVLYGTLYELLKYEAECRKVLESVKRKYNIDIRLMTEVN